MEIITSLYILFWLGLCEYKLKKSLHIIQLEGYDTERYINWMQNNKEKVHTENDKIYVTVLIVFSLILTIFSPLGKKPVYPAIYAGISLIFLFRNIKGGEEAKKPLVFTKRAKRLFGIGLLLLLIDLIITLLAVKLLSKDILAYLPLWAGILTVIYYFSPYYMYGANTFDSFFICPPETCVEIGRG